MDKFGTNNSEGVALAVFEKGRAVMIGAVVPESEIGDEFERYGLDPKDPNVRVVSAAESRLLKQPDAKTL